MLPDENKKKFVAVLNGKIEHGNIMNALGHMTAGLAGCYGLREDMCFLEYKDKDGGVHPHVSHYPFIVLKADNGNQIRRVRTQAIARGIPFTDFTSSMTGGTSKEQVARTVEIAEEDLEYWGVCLFGDTEELGIITGKFSLFR